MSDITVKQLYCLTSKKSMSSRDDSEELKDRVEGGGWRVESGMRGIRSQAPLSTAPSPSPLRVMCTPNLGLLEMGYIYHEIQL